MQDNKTSDKLLTLLLKQLLIDENIVWVDTPQFRLTDNDIIRQVYTIPLKTLIHNVVVLLDNDFPAIADLIRNMIAYKSKFGFNIPVIYRLNAALPWLVFNTLYHGRVPFHIRIAFVKSTNATNQTYLVKPELILE